MNFRGLNYYSANCSTQLAIAIALFATAISLSGCAINGASMNPLGKFLPSKNKPEMTADTPTYKVIFQGKPGGQPKVFTGHLTEPITVQQALEESGATKKYRNMLIDLARRTPQSSEILRLPITYQPGERHVLEQQNYSILPGDEILIRRGSKGPIDAMLRSIGGANGKR